MIARRKKRYIYNLLPVVAIVLFVALWSIFVWHVGVDNLLDIIGVQNGYIIVGLIGLIGGVSTLTSTSLYVTVATLSLAGLDPFFMALIGGIAVSIGDSLFYYLGFKSQKIFQDRYKKVMDKVSAWIQKQPRGVLELFVYIYSSTPFMPIDLLTVSLASLNVSYWRVIIPVFFGNVTLICAVGLLVHHGMSLF